jgi:glycosyltransferase involved in cell wall biosynthesis
VFPYWLGHGEGTFIWQFVKVLRQQQIDVVVVAMHSPGLPTHDNWEGVAIVRPPYWWPVRAEMLRKDGGGLPINFRRYPLARFQLAPLLLAHGAAIARAAKGCDLIHAHFTVSAAAALAGRVWHRLPVVTSVHGSDIFQVPKLPLGAAFTRATLCRSAAVTTVSAALRTACLGLGVPQTQVSVVSNSVDTTIYAPPPGDGYSVRAPLVLFVGSLIRRKGVDTLLHAFARLRQVLPDYRLVVAGEGPELQTLTDLVASLGITPAVEFVGFQSQLQVAALMRQARLFVLPSTEEGQGVVLLEALASGTPVVASRIGGIPEVLAEGTGRLAPPGDAEALAGQMLAVLADPASWQQLSLAGRRHVEHHYSAAAIGPWYRDLYARVLARHSPAQPGLAHSGRAPRH